jgi:hypothetical protein
MKPRRENGAMVVSPTTSDVRRDSAFISGYLQLGATFSRLFEGKANHQPANLGLGFGTGLRALGKKQGRRRSITPTALPAPDIEIGFRPPVNVSCPGYLRPPVIYFTIGEKF